MRPWKWFKELYWNCRDFIHRGRHGFAYVDVWNMDEYLLMLIPDMLRFLAKNSHGYPGAEPFETPEKYDAFLIRLAEKFDACCRGLNSDSDENNKYYNEFMTASQIKQENRTDKQQEVITKYLDETKRLYEENDKHIIEVYKELAENHNILWD